MKQAFIFFIFITCSWPLRAQEPGADFTWPPENSRPDTITKFKFLDRMVPVNKLPKAKPTSNYSFKAQGFKLTWPPVVVKKDIKNYMQQTIKGMGGHEIIDTLYATLLDKDYTAIVVKYKKQFTIFYYIDKAGEQNIFVANMARKKRLKKAMAYIDTYL